MASASRTQTDTMSSPPKVSAVTVKTGEAPGGGQTSGGAGEQGEQEKTSFYQVVPGLPAQAQGHGARAGERREDVEEKGGAAADSEGGGLRWSYVCVCVCVFLNIK